MPRGTNISQETQEREQASQLPLREKWVEAKVYFRGSLRPQCGSAGRKGGTTLRRSEARCLRVAFATMTGLGSFVNAGGVKR